ncbi:hypothetical protein GCM10022225_77710 [Plantactinospora mayteni]|uniref:DUF4352 domain-containing protein n=1 Tax=Plantactinospora mayteni TaxID=566021 RepID=A0ABQ4F2S6_9ACTN|nr:hypothetical protein [Plantactinospora mayteni]GIH01205.1 hypothetical protein Pma05_77770 [Plantactinospora mayteni]
MRPLAKVTAALLLGAVMAVLMGAAPASAYDVRYRAAKSCFVDGREFRAHILTYGKPTGVGDYTEVQLWGYRIEAAGGNTRNTTVQATEVRWIDGSWRRIGGVSWTQAAIEDGEFHRGAIQEGTIPQIGYTAEDSPRAFMVRVYFDQDAFKTCQVTLRPYDLEWMS